MAAAYVFAAELTMAEGQYWRAFERYECVLRAFINGKQKAAEQFAGSFTPRSEFGLLIRNQLSKAFRFPSIAKFLVGRGLLDHFTLPAYPLPTTQIHADTDKKSN
jgi:hypothetical protein